MAARIDEITIVGGGTAGWMTAIMLATFLNRSGGRPPVVVTLIESPNIPTIGVGEATVRGIVVLFRQLGLSETEFFRRSNASFKLAVRFSDWTRARDGRPVVFHHPFNHPSTADGVSLAYHYFAYAERARASLASAMTWNEPLILAARGPRMLGSRDYEQVVDYSYHLDAGLYAQWLREVAVARGVRHLRDDVLDTTLDERGHITSLRLERGGELPVKFVIDCTGFRGLLLQQKLGEPFLSYTRHLLVDSALPVQIPHRSPGIEPVTRATALSAGWVWRVPLTSRVGTGYVFSSQFQDDESARREFEAHAKAAGDLGPEETLVPLKTIRMKVGRTQRAWVGNCLAIGLSGAFVEPLESTAIYMIEAQVRGFLSYFPDESVPPSQAAAYNRRFAEIYDDIVDFIQMHYVTSNRPEPFWLEARQPARLRDSLAAHLERWRSMLPSDQDLRPGLFNEWSYLYCLEPKGYFAGRDYPLTALARQDSWLRFRNQMERDTARYLAQLPDHAALLTEIAGKPPLQPALAAPVAAPAPAADSLEQRLARNYGRGATIPTP
jgi:tryptophan halogenase